MRVLLGIEVFGRKEKFAEAAKGLAGTLKKIFSGDAHMRESCGILT
jgi:hypothetical protein